MSSIVPEGWKELTINEICNKKYGVVDGPFGSNLKTVHYRESGIPVFQSGFVTSNKFVKKKYVYVDEEKYQEQIRSSAGPADILMAKIGMNAGACAVIPDTHQTGILAGNSLKMTVNTDISINHFLVSHLHFMQANGEIRKLLTETAQPAISITTLKKHCVPLPPLPEQKKIATILSSVDEVIEKTQAQIDKLKDLKTGMMQELLTKGIGPGGAPHTEFKDSPVGRIPVGWEVKSLGDCAEYINGNNFKASDWSDNGYPIIRIQNLNGAGAFNFYNKEVNSKWFVETGTLLFAWSGQRGKSFGARIWKGQDGVLNQHIFKVEVKTKLVTKEFLHILMQQVQTDIELHAHGFKDSFMHVKKSDLVSLDVSLPPIVEQKKIVDVLGSIISKLDLAIRKLSEANNLKKALMQDLLTGNVRVCVDKPSRVEKINRADLVSS